MFAAIQVRSSGTAESTLAYAHRRRFWRSGLALLALVALSSLFGAGQAAGQAAPQTLNQRIVTLLESRLGQRMGGGSCSHVATEALRICGGQFIMPGAPVSDYVWSPNLVTKVTATPQGPVISHPINRVLPGDVIQYTNARFSDGSQALHHTSVVASVDRVGRIVSVYEQNIGKLTPGGQVQQQRFLQKRPLDLGKLIAGYVKIYRPAARVTQPRRWEFTVVNNAPTAASCKLGIGTWSSNLSFSAANTDDSYRSSVLTSGSTGVVPTITVGATTLSIVDGAGYEIFRTSSGAVSVRRLAK